MYTVAYMWAKVLGRLEKQLTETVVSACLDDAEVIELTQERLVIYTPSPFREDVIRSQCAGHIKEALKELFDMNVQLEVWGEREMNAKQEKSTGPHSASCNSQFTFENFIEGNSNRFAKQVALMAAQNPGAEMCNPLFIYGIPGVGKTHLIYAVANYIILTKPELKVICMEAEEFTNELVRAIQHGKTAEFRSKYRQADVLLLDDIQFIAGKGSSQEEFYYTYNAMFENNRQIILTADRKPSEMATLTDRLQDRFGSGIMVEITAPDSQTRLQIIYSKAEKYGFKLDAETAEYICAATQNIRQIEGALKKIRAYKELSGTALSLDAVRRLVDDFAIKRAATQITKEMILHQVCRYYSVEEELLKSPQRSRNIAMPRQVAMYLMRQQGKMSLDEIAKCFCRDRATVIHGIHKVEQMLTLKNNELEPVLRDIQSNVEAYI